MSIIERPVLAFLTEEDRLAVGAGTLPGDPPTMDAAVQQLLNLRAANASAAEPDKMKEISKETSSEKSPLDKPEPDKPDTDKAHADKGDADKADSDKPGTDKSDADKADADKADRDNTGEGYLIGRAPISGKTDIGGDGEDDDDDAWARWFSGSPSGHAGRSPVVM